MNKYTFRRLLAGIVIVPVVASLWFVGYAVLVGLGATPTDTPQGVFGNGLVLGVIATIYFMFFEKIEAFLDKVGA